MLSRARKEEGGGGGGGGGGGISERQKQRQTVYRNKLAEKWLNIENK